MIFYFYEKILIDFVLQLCIPIRLSPFTSIAVIYY